MYKKKLNYWPLTVSLNAMAMVGGSGARSREAPMTITPLASLAVEIICWPQTHTSPKTDDFYDACHFSSHTKQQSQKTTSWVGPGPSLCGTIQCGATFAMDVPHPLSHFLIVANKLQSS